MAKKIRFPLEMEQGIEVRSLEELKENFSLARVLVYLENGKLITWLRDRYADDIADAIEEMNKEDKDLAKKICDIFDVSYNEQEEADLEQAAEHNRKLNLLEEYTDEQKYIDVVDQVAFSQDDLYDLLDEGNDMIYLCGEKFSVPLAKKGISYIGINNPTVVIDSKTVVDWQEKDITLQGVQFDEKYLKVEQEKNKVVYKDNEGENNVIDIQIGNKGILFILNDGTEKIIQEKVGELLDRSNKYVVFNKQNRFYYGECGITIVNLKTFEVVYDGNPQGTYGNYDRLKIMNDWIVWSEVSLNLISGEKFLFRKNSLTAPREISGFVVFEKGIVFVVAEYACKRTQSGWAHNFYICDFEWKNERKIISYVGGEGFYIYNDIYLKEGNVYFEYKVGHAMFNAIKKEAFFNLKDEEKNSTFNIRQVYLQ